MIKKKVTILLLIFSILTVFPLQAFAVTIVKPTNVYTFDYPGYVKVTSGNLNVRSGPGTSYEIIDKLANNTYIVMHGDDGGTSWTYITYPVTGWVSKDYVVIDYGG